MSDQIPVLCDCCTKDKHIMAQLMKENGMEYLFIRARDKNKIVHTIKINLTETNKANKL